MRLSCSAILFLGILGIALPAKAQDDTVRFEAYAGYDYTRFNATDDITFVPLSQSVNGNGGSGQFEFNANRCLGIVGDLAGYAVAPTDSPPRTKSPICSGPESISGAANLTRSGRFF